jgi:hypothetical protein
MNADAVFAEYSIDQPLDGSALDVLRNAILAPSSPALRRIVRGAWESRKREYYSTDEFKAADREGIAADEALYRSEALERMVMGQAIADRIGGLTETGKPIWYLGLTCEWSAKIYRAGEIEWDWPAIERLVRARVHGTETIGASNSLGFFMDSYDPGPLLLAAPEPDPSCRTRLEGQMRRLERSEQRTRDSSGRAGYFKPRDAELLAALSRVTARSSPTLDRIEGEHAIVRAERRRLVESVSETWRALFDALFDIRHPEGVGGRDPAQQAVLDRPEFGPLAAASAEVRGLVVAEATVMHQHLERVRAGKVPLPPELRVEDGMGGIGHPAVTGTLGALAHLLLNEPIACDDKTMAALVTRAGAWRDLCRPQLLDSAERTLAAGPAPETEAALRRLAEQPSHCFVPSRPGGDYEGDAWWQDTPGRIAAMLADRSPPAPPAPLARRPSGFIQRLFGRKDT